MDFRHPTIAEINLVNLGKNFLSIRKLVGNDVKVIPIVKADAYGHGAVAVSRCLKKNGADAFGVGYLQEGIELRNAGIDGRIIVFCGIFQGQEELLVKNNLEPVVYTIDTLERLNREGLKQKKKVSVQIKIDTGMGRLGFSVSTAEEILATCLQCDWLQITGVLTHFAEADSSNHSFTLSQARLLKGVISMFQTKGKFSPLVYASNSAAILQFTDFSFNAVRPGLILYGVSPLSFEQEKIDLLPVLQLKTTVVQLKNMVSGTSVSYGRRFFTKRDSVIATIPVGYADG
ncbi:MAG: alanine racemase, partial [Nitrospinota bacterium]